MRGYERRRECERKREREGEKDLKVETNRFNDDVVVHSNADFLRPSFPRVARVSEGLSGVKVDDRKEESAANSVSVAGLFFSSRYTRHSFEMGPTRFS